MRMDSLGASNVAQLPNNHFNNDIQGDRTSWEYHTVTLSRVPAFGFGIAVSGGRDNPHFANGDPSIAVSDVLKAGPAEDRLQVNDRIISVNNIPLENVEYATAVQVLRDSGNTVNLVVKRRVTNHNLLSPSHQHSHSLSSTGLGGTGSQQQIKVIISKANKKDDFGIVLGCRLFIKEISTKAREQLTTNGYSLQEGDIVARIHNTNCNDSMSLKEAKKIIDGCKERLTLAVLRESLPTSGSSGMQSPVYSHTAQVSNCSNMDDAFLNGGSSYSAQNLYVQPPTRPAMSTLLDDKSNLTPRGRSRGPLTDISLQQLDRPSTPNGTSHMRSRSTVEEPPRPPPPRGEDYYSSRRHLYDEDPMQRSMVKQSSEPRYITFQKEGSVGIRLTGGNEVGIFVTAVQQGSPASIQGLVPGDKILKVNDMDMNGVTREEAVLFLLSLQDRIDLIVQYCKEEYDNVTASQRGDSLHIKTHFHCETPTKGEMSFKAGDVFRVVDTLYNGVVGAWQVLRIGRGHQELQRGVIPNKARAEELATAQFNATKKEMNTSESRVSFFRRRTKTHRRSKSLSRENWDDVVFSDSISKFPAYERVVLRHPGFVRPVVLFGPVADLARERLIKDFPDKYTAPLQDDDKNTYKCGIVRLSNIRDIMDRGKHALLDITPNAVDRLNYAQFYPIVIFLKTDSKHTIKQLRQGIPKSAHKSSKKLLEQCQKMERVWSHVFSTTIVLNDADSWYRKLRDNIDQQQSGAVWMSETKPVESLSDDFLFPMTTSRLSYASSPESDLELSPGPSASLSLGNLPQLVKSSSDPSIATNQDNLDRDRELGEGMPPPYTNPYDHSTNHGRRMTVDNKYGFSAKNMVSPMMMDDNNATYGTSTRPPMQGSQGLYGGPDLPPRIDRASKPLSTSQIPPSTSTPGSSLPSRNSSSLHSNGGTIGRSAQERLFGAKSAEDNNLDEYATRSQLLNAADKRLGGSNSQENSLDRSRGGGGGGVGNNTSAGSGSKPNNNGSYDSVSSYDSYNTSQLTAQNIRLGPNAPDDLKSVPNANARGAPLTPNQSQDFGPMRNGNHIHSDSINGVANRSSMHDRSNDFNTSVTSNRSSLYNGPNPHEPLTPRNSNERTAGISAPQRPSNLGLDSPRKHAIIETKTDYGKYSRNNSASQADYTKSPKTPQIGPPSGAPFKPVPPPKPKNYRPPMQGAGNGNGSGGGGAGGAVLSGNGTNGGPANGVGGQWDNGEPITPRSPNGFYYPPTSSHYHQNIPGSPNTNHGGSGGGGGAGANGSHPSMNPYNQYVSGNGYNAANQAQYMGRDQMMNNGYNGNNAGGNNHAYAAGNYMHRGHAIGNMPAQHHPAERHALDLAGSREQRGSAFELYRKPQIGTAGHHHNLREMGSSQQQQYHPHAAAYQQYHLHQQQQMLQQQLHPQHPQQQQRQMQLSQMQQPPLMMAGGGSLNEQQQQQMYLNSLSPLPPQLPAKPKKNLLKSPLAAIKNAFIKTTRPLRRQSSMADSDKKIRPILRRQSSMMESRTASRLMDMRSPLPDPYYQQQQQLYAQQKAPLSPNLAYPQQPGYQIPGLEYPKYPIRHEPFYPSDLNSTYQNLETESIYGNCGNRNYYDQENLYANRALIELEKRSLEPSCGPDAAGAYRSGGRIVRRHSMAERPVANTRRNPASGFASGERHSRESSEEPIYQSRRGSYLMHEGNSRRSEEPIYQSRKEMHRDHLYQSKKEMKERIYQSRREMERSSSDSPGYVTKKELADALELIRDPVYQSRKELKEKGFKTRTQLRDQIYQSRREAMESMAEPIYVSKHEPIYEVKSENELDKMPADETVISASESETIADAVEPLDIEINVSGLCEEIEKELTLSSIISDTMVAAIVEEVPAEEDDTLTSNNESDLEKAAAAAGKIKVETPLSRRALRSPYHISNMIKRTAAPEPIALAAQVAALEAPVYNSCTSMETQYTSSQASLPVGPPNAQSTPYTSHMAISGSALPPPRQPITTTGVFDEEGGTLADNIWNVSLQIPKGAIAPGVKQEIYFTVTDPRLSESVGGPPLDMENGETMLSPLVMCGPQGLEFLTPVTLNIPHCAGKTISLGLSLKATDSEKNLQTDWDNIDLPSNTAAHTVSVKVDHF